MKILTEVLVGIVPMMSVIDSGARKNCGGHLLMERGQGFMWIRVRMLLRPSMECCRLYFTIILQFVVGIVILSVVMGLVRILVRILFGRS